MPIVNVAGLSTAPLSNNMVFDEGDYIVKIEKVEVTTSRQKGTPCWNVEAIIEAGLAQSSNGLVPVGKKFFWSYYIPESGQARDINLSKIAKFVKACGVVISDNMDTDELVGKTIQIHNKPETYNDELRNKVTSTKSVQFEI